VRTRTFDHRFPDIQAEARVNAVLAELTEIGGSTAGTGKNIWWSNAGGGGFGHGKKSSRGRAGLQGHVPGTAEKHARTSMASISPSEDRTGEREIGSSTLGLHLRGSDFRPFGLLRALPSAQRGFEESSKRISRNRPAKGHLFLAALWGYKKLCGNILVHVFQSFLIWSIFSGVLFFFFFIACLCFCLCLFLVWKLCVFLIRFCLVHLEWLFFFFFLFFLLFVSAFLSF